jgi:CheY-like chemotaxis protein
VLHSCAIQALRCDLSSFDLAILDFDMPGMNGRELFLRMRALYARFPILLLSASASTLHPEDGVLFSRCINKGEPVRHLLDVIAAFLDPNAIPDLHRTLLLVCRRSVHRIVILNNVRMRVLPLIEHFPPARQADSRNLRSTLFLAESAIQMALLPHACQG